MLSATDRLQIRGLFARYAWSIDTGDVDALSALFTPDAVVSEPSGVYGPPHGPRRFGEYMRGRAVFPGRQHWIGHSVFSNVTSDSCSVRSFGMGTHLYSTGSTSMTWVGWYEDELVRSDGSWLFRSRGVWPWDGSVLEHFPAMRPTAPSPLERAR